jgi:redox-sensitive bicupin YhaK (pirin superfamily)
VNGTALAEGDGAAISSEEKVTIVANAPAEVLFFDIA